MKNLILLSLSLALMFSCSKIKKESPGSITTEQRSVGYFNSIQTQNNIDVFYTQDSINYLKVETGEHLVNHIKTDVVNGKLIIYEAQNEILNHKQIRVYISNDSINTITLDGSGNFDGQNMNTKDLSVNLIGSGNMNINAYSTNYFILLSGSGNINSTGNSINQNIELKGSGNVGGKNFFVNNSTLALKGSGNITVNTSTSLNATLTGSGNIYYYGNPGTTNTSISGSGQIIQK